ncbi:MAG: chemotaxis protein CheA [Spirochaetaceae bacterium]
MSASADPLETFREEVAELLSSLERALMQLEEDPTDAGMIDEAFRNMHTIKGSGNMLGLTALGEFTHIVEAVFARVRDGHATVSPRLIELGLAARDHIEALLASVDPDPALLAEGERIVAALLQEYPVDGQQKVSDAGGTVPAAAADPEDAPQETTWRIQLRPSIEAFKTGNNPIPLIRELSELGDALIVGFTDHVPALEQLDPEQCFLSWDILLTTDEGENAVRDVFIFVEDDWDIKIAAIDTSNLESTDLDYKRLGEILVERGDIAAEDLAAAVNARSYIGDALVQQGFVTSERVDAALREQELVRRRRESRRALESSGTIKVRTEKLDMLVNLVGEFVSEHATLQRLAVESDNPDILSTAERLEGLIRDTRDLAMQLHMVPVEVLFSSFRRLVRDLAKELDKDVNLVLEGVDTELDKNIVERLKDPLLHIIRNSLDHGLETAAERRSSGKRPQGTLTMKAFYSGAHVGIRVSDDGRGIDTNAVREKAVAQGLISADAQLGEREIHELIFAPGFSTAKKATNVSGRGVGMDVVKQNIEGLGGSIRLESEPGKGSSINLRIPLTLAIVEGLLVNVGSQVYMATMSSVVECLELDQTTRRGEQKLVEYRGSLVPFIDLREYFQLDADQTQAAGEHRQLLMVTSDQQMIGLIVDGIQDTFQSVVKALGKMYEGVEGVSGAVVLGDGRLALMLDLDRLARLAAKAQ